jgi:hypothetical protein
MAEPAPVPALATAMPVAAAAPASASPAVSPTAASPTASSPSDSKDSKRGYVADYQGAAVKPTKFFVNIVDGQGNFAYVKSSM